MAKEYVNQHIVPKRYLERFAFEKNNKYLIGTRRCVNGKVKLFIESVENVGYIKNFYDVSDKDDSKHWEHFLCDNVDCLCGKDLDRIISKATLSQDNVEILSDYDKDVLSKIIISQMLRIPSSLDHTYAAYPRIAKQTKERVLSVLPEEFQQKLKSTIDSVELTTMEQKEIHFNRVFNTETFDKYCNILKSKIWVVYMNIIYDSMPFATSDNPVLVEGFKNSKNGLYSNGLINPDTCFFFPVSPKIAVACYSKDGPVGIIKNEYENRKIPVDEIKFVGYKNICIINQAYNHAFIPKPMFDELNNIGNIYT